MIPKQDLRLDYFNIKPDGNWDDVHSGQQAKTNISYLTKTPEEYSRELNVPLTKVKEKLQVIRENLFLLREQRVHPFKDNKILTDWNGLMISAFAKAAQITGKGNYISFARTAADFIYNNLIDIHGNLLHRYREGEAAIKANLDDYAFFIQALLDLYETTFSVDYLSKAKKLVDKCIKKFRDEEDGAFFFSAKDNIELILNQKDIYDGAIPSGNSIILLNLLRIAKMTGDMDYWDIGLRLIRVFSDSITKNPSAYTQALIGLDFKLGSSYEIIVSSKEFDLTAVQMINEIRKIYLPNKIILLKTDSNNLEGLSDYVSALKPINGKATGYICRNFSCDVPITNPELIKSVILK